MKALRTKKQRFKFISILVTAIAAFLLYGAFFNPTIRGYIESNFEYTISALTILLGTIALSGWYISEGR